MTGLLVKICIRKKKELTEMNTEDYWYPTLLVTHCLFYRNLRIVDKEGSHFRVMGCTPVKSLT